MVISREPVVTAAAIQAALVAIINLASAFGWVSITDEQLATVNGSLAVVLPLLFALFVRNAVTPTAAPSLPSGTAVTLPDGTAGTVTVK